MKHFNELEGGDPFAISDEMDKSIPVNVTESLGGHKDDPFRDVSLFRVSELKFLCFSYNFHGTPHHSSKKVFFLLLILNFSKAGAKQIIEDHKSKCRFTQGSAMNLEGEPIHCRSCDIDENVFEEWDTQHRGSSLVKKWSGKTLSQIIAAKGWTTNNKEKKGKTGKGK